MTNYAFQSKEVAEALSRVGKQAMRGVPNGIAPTGAEHIYAKVPAEGIDGRSDTTCTSGVCTLVRFVTGELIEESGTNVEVYNVSETDLEPDAYIEVFRVGAFWVFDGGSGGDPDAPKRVKFKLTQSLLKEGVLLSGYATADVIDPMNSGLTIGDELTVWDYKKQFVMSNSDAIGIAILGNPYGVGNQWHIEWCEQLVMRVRATLVGGCGPWLGVTTATIDSASSSWPYVDWNGVELEQTVPFTNSRRITAGTGSVDLQRNIPNAYLPSPDNQTAPYTLNPISTEWEIVAADKPTARWCASEFLNSGASPKFILDESGGYAEGFPPSEHDGILAASEAQPPTDVWAEMTEYLCHLKSTVAGWAFLDDNTGLYVTVMTASSLFGTPEKVSAVAKIGGLETDKLIEPTDVCGIIEHEMLTNMLVWGNKTSGGSECKMTQIDPKPEVDVFEHASDITVVTGTTTNADGEIELTTVEIKACDTPSANLSLPYSTQDVITDISCVGDSLEKSYKELKFIGNATGGNSNVGLTCTNPINYDWEVIFNNYIWNQSWYSISYYDINFPEGCFPCPTGCCTQTLYDGSTNQVYPLTDSDCTATVNSSPSNPTDVVSVSWSAGECDDPPAGGCNGTYVSGFSIGGFGGVSGCSATFTQTGTALISGGTATINGNWSGVAGSMPQGSVAGTFTFTTDGTNHSASGALPSAWGGGTVSVSNTGTCTGTYQGSASLSGGNSPCGGMINGTHDFTLT